MLTGSEVTLVESHLLHLAPNAMLVVDQSGRIVQANILAERLFGHPQRPSPANHWLCSATTLEQAQAELEQRVEERTANDIKRLVGIP